MGLNSQGKSPQNFSHESQMLPTVAEFWCSPCPVSCWCWTAVWLYEWL